MEQSNWQWFNVGKLFTLQKCKCSNATELLEEGDEIAYIGAKKTENGVMQIVKRVDELVTRGNCLVFIGDGQGSVGYCIYQPIDFIGSTTLIAGYNKHLNPFIASFLISVLDKERYRYSFGRKYKKEIIANSQIQLPAIKNAKDEYEPNWQYMETFVKDQIIPQLPKKAQKVWLQKYDTKPLQEMTMKLNTDEWKEFALSDIFTIRRGKTLTSDVKESNEGEIPCVNGTSTNNGILCYLNEEVEKYGFEKMPTPSLSLCRVGTSGLTFVQTKPYYIADNAFCLQLKENQNFYVYLFLSTLLDKECIKYCYGRTISSEKYMRTIIRLPVTPEGTPDWQFMEDYIKSLPYSKNIAPSDPKEVVDELVEMKKEMIKMRRAMEAQHTGELKIIGGNVTFNDYSTNYNVKK